MWCLQSPSTGPQTIFINIRDRASILLSSQTAFRGDSARSLLWSDLFLSKVPMHDISEETVIPVKPPSSLHCLIHPLTHGLDMQAFAAIADNAKHNQTGRVDEHGALRHRVPELCGVGALAMLFFAHFHILDNPVPDFTPDFDSPESGQYGIRDWYEYHVFYATRHSLKKEMTYQSECCRVHVWVWLTVVCT
jgi:hypothetical protein